MKYRLSLLLLALLLLVSSLQAQQKTSLTDSKPMAGLYLTVDAGLVVPNAKHADFYSGKPGYSNSINRVLNSELYGSQIWNNLTEQGLISPSAIGSYRELNVVEYPQMYYKLAYQLGVGFRYAYKSGWGWLLRFDYCMLNAAGQFNLSSDNGTGILGNKQYITCDIYGVEKRTLIDFGIVKRVPLTERIDLELDLGLSLNSTKVQKNAMRIAGQTYSILDVWNGSSPYNGIGTYSYVNEGRMGFGDFATLALSYRTSAGTIDFGYTLYYMQTKFVNYNEQDCYAFQHNIFFRFNVNNFKFFD